MKKIIPIAGLILSMTAASVNAQLTIVGNELNINTGILTVEGVTDTPNSIVSLNIPKVGITPENLQMSDNAGADIVYSGQKLSDTDGKFTFMVDFNGVDEGIYDIYIGGKTETEAKKTKTSYLETATYEALISSLNTAALSDKAGFDILFGQNEEKLFLYSDVEA